MNARVRSSSPPSPCQDGDPTPSSATRSIWARLLRKLPTPPELATVPGNAAEG